MSDSSLSPQNAQRAHALARHGAGLGWLGSQQAQPQPQPPAWLPGSQPFLFSKDTVQYSSPPRRDAACAGTTDGALLLNLRLISWGKGFQPPWFFDGSINGGRIYYFIIGSHLLSPFSYPLLSTLLCRGYRRRVTTLSLQCDRRT